MKKISLLIFCFLVFSCSSDSDPIEKVEVEKDNKAPGVPELSAPEDNLFCVENELDFSWLAATDPEGDNVTYLFEISKTSDFSNIFFKRELSGLSLNKEVDKGVNYYWRVLAKDIKGNSSSYSPVRNFYTEDSQSANSLPSVPKKLKPGNYTVYGTEVELVWESIDLDDDEVKYDLYFGTSSNPPLVKENFSPYKYTVTDLVAGTVYYWKIVAKDEKGGKTVGQIWSFKTS